MKKIILPFLLSLIFLSSCVENKNAQLIVGNWKGAEWLQNGQLTNHNVSKTFFSFDKDGNYSYSYEESTEKGSYKVENDMLFTHPEGQQERMVKIAKVNTDTLVFDMSRGGNAEKLTLIRNK